MTTQTGTVKWFNESKGFGFIAQDAGGADLFAHFRDIQGNGFKTLIENQRVEFEVKQGQKGLQAANIKRALSLAGAGPEEAAALPRLFFVCATRRLRDAVRPTRGLTMRRDSQETRHDRTRHPDEPPDPPRRPPGRPADARRLELHRPSRCAEPGPAACW